MNIGIYNSPSYLNIPNFIEVTSLDTQVLDAIDMFLVYWRRNRDGERSSFEQLALIDLCLKREIPIKIIDLDYEMTYDEAFTSIKSGISLFEPYLVTRKFFTYLPEPALLDVSLLSTELRDRDINVCYHQRPNLSFPGINIQVVNDFIDAKCYLNCDPIISLANGRISRETFQAVQIGCIPLIPMEHRYFHGLVSGIGSPVTTKDIQYYINRATDISYGYCYDFIQNIKNNYPEFTYEQFIHVINSNS